jgi:hypothetical protein
MTLNGQQIIDKFHNYVSDELDSDFELQLASDAKDALEIELQLEITKKVNTTESVSAGQTSATARNLPDDFFLPLPIYFNGQQILPVPFERQHEFENVSGYYWIDMASGKYHLTGTQGANGTVYFYYQYETPELTLATAPVWARFSPIIPLEMARMYWQIDQGEKNRAWTMEYQADYLRWKNMMQDWDARLKLNAINHSVADTYAGDSPDRINLD